MGDADDVGELEDAILAARVAAAGAAARHAETELYRRLAPRVRLYGLRHLRDAQAADDLVQEVLLMTFDRLRAGAVREPGLLASFVLGMCRRVVIERYRTHARHERLLRQYGNPAPTPEPAPTAESDLARLRRCLERLSERERAVIVDSFYGDRPARAIAAGLGLSEGNVRVLRHRGLQRLRDCVTDAGA